MELLYIASDLTNALPPYECPIAKIDLLTRQTSARTYEFAQSTPRWIVELCRQGLQSRSKQLEAGGSERGTGWIRVGTRWIELSLIPDVTTEVATIVLFRIQQFSG